MYSFRSISLLVLLIASCILTASVFKKESEKRVLKAEFIELSKIKYGIFSVDEWKVILAEIVIKKVNDFDLQASDEEELRERISQFLDTAVDELEESFFEQSKGSVTGFFKGGIANITNVFGVMKEDIPLLTESILAFINDTENKELAKNFLIEELNDYADNTFSEIDYELYDEILEKHNVETKEEGIASIRKQLDYLEHKQKPYTYTIFGLVFLLMLITIFSPNLKKADFLLLTFHCFILLAIGVVLPMINIDARISKMEFQLLGEQISFTDQVLYYKSKSILEVVQLMIVNGKWDVLAVGVLVLSFSVIFPIAKLSSSIIYLYSTKLRNSKLIKFLVFKTAKWSMADVMVVAIFMAYIGFSGIISEQLLDLEKIAINLDIMTTNESNLQIGFFLFTCFAVLSLLLSQKLQFNFKDSK